jgi:hypothetical protein
MSLAQAMWTHGTSVQVEYVDRVRSIFRRGYHTRIVHAAGDNWFHYAIPTPVIVSDRRLRIDSVMVTFETGDQATVRNVHIYDGPRRIATHDNLSLMGDHPFERFPVSGAPEVQWGVGISVRVEFGVDLAGAWVQFVTAGADFL